MNKNDKNMRGMNKIHAYNEVSHDTIRCVETDAVDELRALSEVHYFFFQAMEAMFDSYETQMSTDWTAALGGLTQWTEWMIAREKRVQQLVEDELAGADHPAVPIEPIASLDQSVGDQQANKLHPADMGSDEIMPLLTTLIDKSHQVTALNQFADDATIALLSTGYNIESNTRFGMNEFQSWVRENEVDLKAMLNKLKEQLHAEDTEMEIKKEEKD